MALDHGPGHSMTCVSRFWLSEPVDRRSFLAAVAAVARDNPFLAVRRRGGSWLAVDFAPDVQVDWGTAAIPIDWRHLAPDDSLVRWTVRTGRLGDLGIADAEHADRTGTLVVLRYPHAVADGLGAAAAMRQVCDVLAGRSAPRPTEADLEARHALGGSPVAGRRRRRWEVDRIARYFTRWPAPFAPDGGTAASGPAGVIACERMVASAAATAALRAASRAAGVTLNDVLLASLFRVLRQDMDPGAVIRIAVPTSLRPPGNAAFCNQVSMVFLQRKAARAADPGLLSEVSREMNHVKRWRLGNAMHWFLGHGFRVGEGAIGLFMRLPVVSTTAVLSNLGEPFAAAPEAGLRVVAHDLLSPLRPGTNLAIAAVGHDGRLGLTARYAPDHVSPERARRVLERTFAEAAGLLQAGTGAG
ncbi:MAG: hypothetical protein ACKOZU_01340 [Planctomycetaceae bacterium]